jgi:hypothetical protein
MKEPDDRSRRYFVKASSMLGLAVAFGEATIREALQIRNPILLKRRKPWPKPVLDRQLTRRLFVRFR